MRMVLRTYGNGPRHAIDTGRLVSDSLRFSRRRLITAMRVVVPVVVGAMAMVVAMGMPMLGGFLVACRCCRESLEPVMGRFAGQTHHQVEEGEYRGGGSMDAGTEHAWRRERGGTTGLPL